MATRSEGSAAPLQVLVVDDDPIVLEMARFAMADPGSAEASFASSAAEAFAALDAASFDLVFLDLGLGDRSGAPLLSDVIAAAGGALVAVVTADERPGSIVECMKRGAFDYLTKPISPARLMTIIGHVRSIAELRQEVSNLGGESGRGARNPAFSRILTKSPLMLGLFKALERVARSPLAVLVAGESGVGKELVARAIHDLSKRPGAFVPVNVAGLDDTLFADTLFGHNKGAYTGAEGKRLGLVREAKDGTLFLDEIGDLGSEAQVKLLRFLQDGEFYPLGSDKPERGSARLVMATNADLLAKVREGSFRADLYYRLTIHYVAVPPLRERREDIPMLVEKFAEDAAEALGRPAPKRVDGFLRAIEGWSFPGNIRELFSLVHGAMSWAEGSTLPAAYALDYIRSARAASSSAEAAFSGTPPAAVPSDEPFPTLEEMTERHIQEALRRSGGNQSMAARLLGISQSTISRRLSEIAMKNA
jgi:DNA-binding NtrC family response regulator